MKPVHAIPAVPVVHAKPRRALPAKSIVVHKDVLDNIMYKARKYGKEILGLMEAINVFDALCNTLTSQLNQMEERVANFITDESKAESDSIKKSEQCALWIEDIMQGSRQLCQELTKSHEASEKSYKDRNAALEKDIKKLNDVHKLLANRNMHQDIQIRKQQTSIEGLKTVKSKHEKTILELSARNKELESRAKEYEDSDADSCKSSSSSLGGWPPEEKKKKRKRKSRSTRKREWEARQADQAGGDAPKSSPPP